MSDPARAAQEGIGTEVEPDWFAFDGSFEDTEASSVRAGQVNGALLTKPSDGERQRLAAQNSNQPQRRWHYRYVAVDLAWEAAQLFPNETDELVRLFCEAGGWIKAQDPKGADKFYKALVRRCGSTALGKEADRLRWFPRSFHPDEN